MDLDPVPAPQVTRSRRKSPSSRSRNPTIHDMFKPVRTRREVRLFWQLWHVHTHGKKTSWVRMSADWNQLIGLLPIHHAIHYYGKSAQNLESFLDSFTSRLRRVDVSAFAQCMHRRLRHVTADNILQSEIQSSGLMVVNAAAQTAPAPPCPQPCGTVPGPVPAFPAPSHSSAIPSHQAHLHAAEGPQYMPGPTPDQSSNGTSGCAPSFRPAVPSHTMAAAVALPQAQPQAAAPSPMQDPSPSGHSQAASQQGHKRAPAGHHEDAPVKKQRGAPAGAGQNCKDCWAAKCLEQSHKAPADIPHNVPLKDGHKKHCPNQGKFDEAQLDDKLKTAMNRVLKPPKPRR